MKVAPNPGLALNVALGWWWADPVAALAIAGLAIKEGREAWQGDNTLGTCAFSEWSEI